MFLLLTGVIALLDQAHLLSWGHAWPLYLILWGVLALAERAAIAQEDVPPPPPGYMAGFGAGSGYPGGYPGGPVPPAAPAQPTEQSTSIVPVHGDEINHPGSNRGGQS
jgi:hypothetical protein